MFSPSFRFRAASSAAVPSSTDGPWSHNDELRQRLIGGMAVITPGIAALGQEAVARIVMTIEVYDDFCHANDPQEEHDFGAFGAEGHRIFFTLHPSEIKSAFIS